MPRSGYHCFSRYRSYNLYFIINATTISSGTTTTLNLRSGATRNLAASPPVIQNGDNVTVQIVDNFGCSNQQTIPIIIDDWIKSWSIN
ncbi:MAG: hypothetical protein CM15mP122_5390 [Bacteroidota bacterium]|nr:MAG: hypothetical protein CM15mP122_5390 [Bacteroidota bacterium]